MVCQILPGGRGGARVNHIWPTVSRVPIPDKIRQDFGSYSTGLLQPDSAHIAYLSFTFLLKNLFTEVIAVDDKM